MRPMPPQRPFSRPPPPCIPHWPGRKAPANSSPARWALLAQNEAAGITLEMQQQLRATVHYQNGLLVIRERGGVTVEAGETIQWTIDCGDGGVGVTFSAPVYRRNRNGTAIQLSTGDAVADDQCQRVAPAVGETLLAISRESYQGPRVAPIAATPTIRAIQRPSHHQLEVVARFSHGSSSVNSVIA